MLSVSLFYINLTKFLQDTRAVNIILVIISDRKNISIEGNQKSFALLINTIDCILLVINTIDSSRVKDSIKSDCLILYLIFKKILYSLHKGQKR